MHVFMSICKDKTDIVWEGGRDRNVYNIYLSVYMWVSMMVIMYYSSSSSSV